jgi:alkanesulfonate monooxygenase SsuD/methylene tetrahydromethanopterin reductase-like flavin-dependent oxidoreductase (luciferase family)
VLSSDGPVRVFEQATAVDLVSRSRAELMAVAGRCWTPSGCPVTTSRATTRTSTRKLRLSHLRAGARPSGPGRFRPSLVDELVLPRPVQDPLPVWVAVGGSPSSMTQAAALGLSLPIGAMGGTAARFRPLAQLDREALDRYRPHSRFAVTLHGFAANTSQQAERAYVPADAELFTAVGERRSRKRRRAGVGASGIPKYRTDWLYSSIVRGALAAVVIAAGRTQARPRAGLPSGARDLVFSRGG